MSINENFHKGTHHQKTMELTRKYHDSNEKLLSLLEKEVNIAYQKIAILDFQSTDEEITSAIMYLGYSLHAYRIFLGEDPKSHK
jgi:hypothetical protein